MSLKLLIILTFFPHVLYAWDNHEMLTQIGLQPLGIEEKVKYVSLDEVLSKGVSGISARTPVELLKELKLNKQFQFEQALQESSSQEVLASQVIAKYSDEPDWGGDQNLFESDQYPELWTKDTRFVSQRSGLGSQGFRHMYFPGEFDWKRPLITFQIPMRRLGEAPERAQLFYELSKKFFKAGQRYWGYRFLGWTLHYVQDLFQPFHVCQAPSLRVIKFKWKGIIPQLDIVMTAKQIAYYHLSYEKWIERKLEQEDLKSALNYQPQSIDLDNLFSHLIKSVIPFSFGYASQLGTHTRKVFNPISPSPDFIVSEFVGTEDWMQGVRSNRGKPLMDVTKILFKRMGDTSRTIVTKSISR